jgi:hypothetical protein
LSGTVHHVEPSLILINFFVFPFLPVFLSLQIVGCRTLALLLACTVVRVLNLNLLIIIAIIIV